MNTQEEAVVAEDTMERLFAGKATAGDQLQAFLALQELSSFARPFQARVNTWMEQCFGEVISNDVTERNHRLVEEVLELGQSCEMTASEAHQLVDYVFSRPVGERRQEYGGVMVTLAAHACANGDDMYECGEIELARIWTKVEEIRAKQAAKPKHSPLPISTTDVFEQVAKLREIVKAWLPSKRGEYLELISKYAGTPIEKDKVIVDLGNQVNDASAAIVERNHD